MIIRKALKVVLLLGWCDDGSDDDECKELVNFPIKGWIINNIRLCRPCNFCHRYSDLLLESNSVYYQR